MKRILAFLLCLFIGVTAFAQSAKEIYEEGKKLYEDKKYKEAFVKFSAAAETGNKKAQYYLGRCYDKGNGVKEDNNQAFNWYSKSAAQDYAKAQYQLGKCYKKGKGVAKDEQKAKELYLKAVNNPKGGDKILPKLKEDAAEGDGIAKEVLKTIKK